MNDQLEFTGEYEHCHDCNETWDWHDSCCPECGSDNVDTMSAKQVRDHHRYDDSDTISKIEEMLGRHFDL